MTKKQFLIILPLVIIVVGLLYFGIQGKPQPASIGAIATQKEIPIDYSLPNDIGDIVYGENPNDGSPIMFESTQ